MQMKLDEKTDFIELQRGVEQGDTISPKILILPSKHISKHKMNYIKTKIMNQKQT